MTLERAVLWMQFTFFFLASGGSVYMIVSSIQSNRALRAASAEADRQITELLRSRESKCPHCGKARA